MKLWTERGFEHGVENTTVEEIARAAGVTKGTFYFHFAHKEDVLLEMSLTTSDAVNEIAKRSAAEGDSIDEIILKAFTEMARRTERLPRAAIARTIREFYKYPTRARELSDSEFDLTRARLDAINARIDLRVAKANLNRAVGGVTQ